MKKLIAGLFAGTFGLVWALLAIAITVAGFICYINGIIFGFGHSVVLGLVSIIPFVGFFEGLFHLAGVLH